MSVFRIARLKNALLIIWVFLMTSCNENGVGYDEHEKVLFDKIKPGMTSKEVIQILGKPDTILYAVGNNEYVYCQYNYFTKNKFGWSSKPYVSFGAPDSVSVAAYDEDTE